MACDKKHQRETGAEWDVDVPCSDEVLELEEVGLQSISHYVEVRHNTIARFFGNRPIFGFCVDTERSSGSSPRQW